ncbi:MAG: alpha/beta fold hydrolase [Bacteroidia bacterium]|nr:alpha/beta fold hydrolase [Bacteroidia bacterium]
MLLHSNIIGEGKPFVILHGFLGMSDNWKAHGRQFSLQGFQVHLLDQRNHGRSFHSDEFDYELLSEDLYDYCLHNDLEDIVLLGHSMGGKTAMQFAARYPQMLSKLIVADIAPKFYPRHHQAILKGLSALNFDEIETRKEAEVILSNYVLHKPTRQFLLKNVYWVEPGKLALRLNLIALIDNIDEVGEALPAHLKYEGETMFLKGDRSEYITTEDEIEIKRQFPNVVFETLENAGHWLHAENPESFFNSVINFICN